MGRFLTILVIVAVLLGAGGLWLTRPKPLPESAVAGLEGDPAAGRQVFLAAGCAACHAKAGAEGQEAPEMSGGRRLATAYGTFVAPNISPDAEAGIGAYTLAGLASVLKRGVTPEGKHLYPVMPYATYARMRVQDIADLKAYLDTLPAVETPAAASEVAFPYSLRSLVGFWKWRYLDTAFVGAAPSPQMERGRYLVEALGHCAECHTPRDRFGGLDRSRWMAGAPNPVGTGEVPNITPAAIDWSRSEMVWYLQSGFTPSHEEVAGEMEPIIAGLGQLPEEDREAIAVYLAGLAPVE
ncbi:c-type cytochrome [Tropicimonas isoalkanivorans]|uniref:Cytochrome c, mono-and diheme variants n=1 Tax=Tropicimonas isoalkanivorans TaxID=441112 RepID=A0A1I1EGD1_9RHOB|nr:c-type cytochrome [Tropicimonas isoalkanivorans]SFB84408.1 Cytochrome c, mono-and diheme variants [Tropicimonas isoalkanivorans]